MAQNSRLKESKNGRVLVQLFKRSASVLSAMLLLPDAEENLEEIRAVKDAEVQKLLEASRQYADTEMQNRYAQGMLAALSAIQSAGGIEISAPDAGAHNTIVQSMVSELRDDFARGILSVGEGIESAVTKAQRQSILGTLSDGNRIERAQNIRSILQEQGTKGLLDRGGKRWDITTYANMLVRTKEREAFNVGMIARANEVGVFVFRINDTGSTHAECAKWENQYVSQNGEFGLPTVEDATSDGVFHPNCRHRLIPSPQKQRELES